MVPFSHKSLPFTGSENNMFNLLKNVALVVLGLSSFNPTNSSAHGATVAKAPAVFSVEQDHRNMMQQLGITRLRPGRSPDQNSPNAANFDEAKANPYPELPDVLKTANGDRVTTPEQWRDVRRPEIVEMFAREILGRIPDNVPDVQWEVRETREVTAGGRPAIEQHIVGVVDNSACPEIEVNISMSLTLPKDAGGPVPVLMSFGWTPFDPVPAFFRGRGGREDGSPQRLTKKDKLIAAGWGCATLNPTTVQDDAGGYRPPQRGENADREAAPRGAGLTRGIIGLANLGQPRKPDDWGALRAWAWGASRALDYLETRPDVNPQRVGIAGVSRYGKAALVTMALDERFPMGLIASSGEGGTSLYRRNFGEAVENLAGSGAYHWMAGNFLKYATEESSFGSMNADDMPVDSHELIALCAPRLTFISHGVPERGDAQWLDHQGSFMAAIAAQPVFRLLGARDLGRSDDYKSEKMPDVNVGLLDGQLAWRQHDGGHTDEPNVEHFIQWADKMLAFAQPSEVGPLHESVPSETASAEAKVEHEPIERRDPNSVTAHKQLLAKTRQGQIDIYFEGDSITRRWGATDYPQFLALWNKDFHGWNAANFAWGGDTTHNILWRLQHGELDGARPKVVVLQAGTNNLPWEGPADDAKVDDVVNGIQAIIGEFQKRVPDATIILIAVFPRPQNRALAPTIKKINERLATLADGKRIRFMNINDKLSDSNGNLLPGYSPDGLHLLEPGYEVWAAALKPVFTELLGPPAAGDHAPPPTGDPSAAQ